MIKNNDEIKTLTKDESQKHIDNIRSKWDDAKSKRRARELSWMVNYLSYKKSDKVYFIDDSQLKEVNISKLKSMQDMQTNLIYPMVRDLESQIESAKPLFSADITNYRVKDFDASIQQALARQKFDEWERNGVIDHARIFHITTGNSVIKMYNNKKGGKWVVLSNGDAVKEGEVVADVVPIFDFVYDDSYGTLKRGEWAIHRVALKKCVAEKIFPDKKFIFIKAGKDVMDYSTGNYYNEGEEIVFVYEYYRIACDEYPNGLFIQTDFNSILDYGDNPTPGKTKESSGSQLPFAHEKAVETTDAEGETPITYARPSIKAYNNRRRQLNQHAARIMKPMLDIDRRSQIKEEKIASENVTVIRSNKDKRGSIGVIQPGDFSNGFYNNMALYKQDIEEISGVKPLASVGTRTPAMSLAIQREVSTMGNSMLIKRFYYLCETALNLYLDFVRDKYIEDRTVEYFDGEDYVYAEYVGSRLNNNVKIKLSGTYGLSDNKIFRQQQVERLLALGMITLEKAKELMQFGELDKAYNSEIWDKIRASMENDHITNELSRKKGKNKMVYVDIYENHIIHIEKHIERLRKSDMFIYPGMPSSEMKIIAEARVELYSHIEYHWYAIGVLLSGNILQAGIVLGLDSMSQRKLQLLQMSMQQIQMAAQKTEQTLADIQKRAPKNLAETNFADIAQGLGAIMPDTKKLEKLQGIMQGNIINDIMSSMSSNEAPPADVGAQEAI